MRVFKTKEEFSSYLRSNGDWSTKLGRIDGQSVGGIVAHENYREYYIKDDKMEKLNREQAIDWMLESEDNYVIDEDGDHLRITDGEGMQSREYSGDWIKIGNSLYDVLKMKSFTKVITQPIDPKLLEIKRTLDDAQEKLNKLMEGK